MSCRRRILSVLAGLACTLAAAGTVWSAVPELRVGFESFEPYQIDGDPPRGIDVDLTGAILERAGCTARFVRQPWARQLESLEEGKLDILMVAGKNAERARFAEWTSLFRPLRIALMAAPRGAPHLRSLEELAGRSVTIGSLIGLNYLDKYKVLPDGTSIASLFVTTTSNLSLAKMLLAARPGLMDRLNEAIAGLRADGTYAAIFARYGVTK